MRTSRLIWVLLTFAMAPSCSHEAEPAYEPGSYAAPTSAGGEHERAPTPVAAQAAPARPPEPAGEALEEPAPTTGPTPATPERADVYLNGVKLGEPDLRELEVRVERRPEPGKYWYDTKSGLWGLIGHGASGLTAPRLRAAPLAQDAASGTTAVVVNGRELNLTELAALASLLVWPSSELPNYAGRYTLDDRAGLYGPGNRYLGNLTALAAKSSTAASTRCVWLHLGSARGPLGRNVNVDCD